MTDQKADPRPAGPFSRKPPVIDLASGEFGHVEPAGPARPDPAEGTVAGDEEPTAIEPTASTGLDGAVAATGASDTVVHAKFGERPASVSDLGPAPTGRPEDLVIGGIGERPGSNEPADASLLSADGTATGDGRGAQPEVGSKAAPPRRTGFGSLAAAALLGGVVGAGVAIGTDTYRHPAQTDLGERVAALEARGRSPAVSDPAVAGLDRRLGALESQTKAVAETAAAARTAAETSARQAAEALSRPSTAPGSATASPDVALRESIEPLAARVATLEDGLRAAVKPAALDDIRTALRTVQAQADDRARAAANATQALQALTSGLNGRAGALDQKVAALGDEVAKLPAGLMQAGLRAVVAGQIGDDLRAGTPLGPALGALDKLGGGASTDALRPFATEAAPTTAALLTEFRALESRLGTEPAAPSASFGDRLLHIADKIVTVRAVNDGTGSDIPGLAGRVETALGRGSATDAADAWNQIPEASRRSAADWGTRLGQRAAADIAARRIAAESLAAFDAPTR